jgi:hypothetical protein
MHIQDGGMLLIKNKSIYFENQARYEIIVKEVHISLFLNVLSNKTNLIYISISL